MASQKKLSARLFFIIVLIFTLLVVQPCRSQNFEWVQQIGGANANDAGFYIASDNNNNTYHITALSGAVTMAPGPGSGDFTALGMVDMLITKRNPQGDILWVNQLGGPSAIVQTWSLSVDATGNVYISGTYHGTVDFDSGVGSWELTTEIVTGFLLKLNASGNFLWVKSIGHAVYPHATDKDSGNNIYLTGTFTGTVDFDPGAGEFNMSAGNGTAYFILKVSANGNFQWAKKLVGSADYSFPGNIGVDGENNVYITGEFLGSIDLDPGPGSVIVSSGNYTSTFIVKVSPAGNYLWSQQLTSSSPSATHVNAIDFDQDDNLYLTGRFDGTVDFAPGSAQYTMTTQSAYSDMFVYKVSPTGNLVWARQLETDHTGRSFSLEVDNCGGVYVMGHFFDTIDFDPGPGSYPANADQGSVFLLKLNQLGEFIYAIQLLDLIVYDELVTFMTVDNNQNIYITGQFIDNVDFDMGAGTHYLTSNGGNDSFLLKLSGANPPLFDPIPPQCPGSPSPLPLVSPEGISGSWSPAFDPFNTRSYTFTPNPGSCAIAATLEVAILAAPELALEAFDPVSCNGAEGTILIAAQGEGTLVWQGPSQGTLENVSFPYVLNGLTAGTYEITLIQGGCSSAPATVTLANPEEPVLFEVADIHFCGGSYLLGASLISGNNLVNAGFYAAPGGVDPIELGTVFDSANTPATLYIYASSGNCTSEVSFTLSVSPQVNPTFEVDPILCQGASNPLPEVSLEGITGEWSPAFDSNFSQVYTFIPDPGQCADQYSFNQIIVPAPQLQLVPSPPLLCGGADGSIIVNASGIGDVLWSGTVSGSATGVNFPYTLGGLPEGDYQIVIVQEGCASAPVLTSLAAAQAPELDAIADISICAESFVLDTALITGAHLVNPGFYMSAGGEGPIAQGNVFSAGDTPVTIYAYDANGSCSSQISFSLTVTAPITPTFDITQPLCQGASNPLPATSLEGITGSWSPAFDPYNSQSYTFTPAAGQCGVMVTSNLSVYPAVTLSAQGVAPSTCNGMDGSITVQAQGVGELIWSGPATGSISQAVFPYQISGLAPGVYTLTFIQQGCSSQELVVSLDNPDVPLLDPIQDIIVCDGSYELNDSLISGSNTVSPGFYHLPGGESPVAQDMVFTVENTPATVFAYDQSGACEAQVSFTITVTGQILPEFSLNQSYCAGVPSPLPQTALNGISGSWSPSFDPFTSQEYVFTPDPGQCAATIAVALTITPCECTNPPFAWAGEDRTICPGEAIVLEGTANMPVFWVTSGDGVFENANAPLTTYFPGVADLAGAALTLSMHTQDPDGDGPCLAAHSDLTITFLTAATLTFEAVTICAGDALAFPPTGTLTGDWSAASPDNQNSAVYYFTADPGQCTQVGSWSVTVDSCDCQDPPYAGADVAVSLCSGDAAFDLMAVLDSTADAGGLWWPPLSSGSSVFTPGVDSAGSYTYTLAGVGACPQDSAEVAITYWDAASVFLEEGHICLNRDGTAATDYWLTAQGMPQGQYTYRWFRESDPMPFLTTALPQVAVTAAGNYYVMVSDPSSQCSLSSNTAEVTASVAPAKVYGKVYNNFTASATVEVIVVAGQGPWLYSMDDQPYQDHNFFYEVGPGEHTITLRDQAQCIREQSVVFVLDYPRFFSPNHDGYNDLWHIRGLQGADGAEVTIFDRYGKILRVLKAHEFWDGTYRGTPMPATDYWFRLRYESEGASKEFSAHFSLVR